MGHNAPKDVPWSLRWVYMMVHIAEDCIHVPCIGCKTLTVQQKTYNDVHGYYRAQMEHLFACLWSWKVVHDIWLGP